MDRTVLEGVCIDKTIEMLFQFTSHFGRSTGTGTIEQPLGPLIGKALHPFAQGRIRQVEGRGDGGDVLTCDHRMDSLCPAKDTRLLGLLEHGF
jgi:hypothetical protein